LRQRAQAHVDHERLPLTRELIPMQFQLAVLARVAGDENARLRIVAMSERDAGVRSAAARRGDARHDLERDLALRQRLDLLTAAPEDEWIAALEPQHALAFARELHEQRVDLVLRHLVLAWSLADEHALGIAAHEVEHARRDQAVV